MPKRVRPLIDYEKAVKRFKSKGFDIKTGKDYTVVYHEKHVRAVLTLPQVGKYTKALWNKIRQVLSIAAFGDKG